MSKRVFIGVGHGGSDPGAVGKVKEADANLIIALELKRILELNGLIVGISRTKDENDDLNEEINEANKFKPDVAVEVHNNAGGGDGFEVFVQTNKHKAQSRALAQAIEKEVKAIGQNSRGIKTKLNSSKTDWFGWLRRVNAPAVLTEGFFVDTKDALDFDMIDEQKKLAQAYAKGVMNYLNVKPKSMMYRVRKSWNDAQSQIGAYTDLKNAQNKADQNPDHYVFDENGKQVYPEIIEPFKIHNSIGDMAIRTGPGEIFAVVSTMSKGIYTIIETRGDWGKLKSGVGWISLKYTKRI